MNTMYDAVMKMEQLLGVYERLIDDLAGYMKENGIDYTNDDSVHPAIMLYSEAGRSLFQAPADEKDGRSSPYGRGIQPDERHGK